MNRLGLMVVFASGLFACGSDALVGGTCKAGYVAEGGECVVAKAEAPAATETNSNLPDDTTDHDAAPPTPANAKPVTNVNHEPPPVVVPPPIDPVDPPPIPPTDHPPVIVVPDPLTCEAPLVSCRDQCIPVDSDPMNCGACGRMCPSNICVAGECVGGTPGDVVLIGHDMHDVWAASAQAKVLTNTVAIPTTEPIRVLSYEAGADAATASWTRFVIQYGLPARTVKFTTATEADLQGSALYAQYDVVLVHGAPAADPASLGTSWSTALQTFTKKGGVFVGVDSGKSDMPSLVNATGLLEMSGHTPLDASMHFLVSGPNDIVGRNVLSPYAAYGSSVAFDGLDLPGPNLTYVVQADDESGLPIVVHRVAR